MSTYLEYDGKPVPLADLSWYEVAPCGCTCGVTSAECGSWRVLTVDEAWTQFFDTKAEREKYRRLGFTFELGLRKDCADRLSSKAECPHTPTYGVPPRPEPEGYAWACASGWGTPSNARLHLFRAEHVDREENWRDGFPNREAMCGAETTRPSAKWHHTSGRVECSRCMKAGVA